MKVVIKLIAAFLLFSSCKSKDNLDFSATINIDSTVYGKLQNQFNARSLVQAPNYLGGLRPNYPIAIADMDCAERDSDWMTGGFICTLPKIVVKKPDGYILINNRRQLRDTYAPITTSQEALGYAVLYTRFFAVLNESFFKGSYDYFGETPSISYVKRQRDSYIVHLFSYKTFGCEHPYYSILVKVDKDGSVEILKQEKSFENPKTSNLCVD